MMSLCVGVARPHSITYISGAAPDFTIYSNDSPTRLGSFTKNTWCPLIALCAPAV